MDWKCVCSWILYFFQSKISKHSYNAYNTPSIEAMVRTMVARLEHLLLSIPHGAQGAFK